MKNMFPQTRQAPVPPPELGRHGAKLWKALHAEYDLTDPAGTALLTTACRTEDDIIAMRETVAAEGNCILNRHGQSVAHPLLAAISRAETVKRQTLRALNLDLQAPPKIGRPMK